MALDMHLLTELVDKLRNNGHPDDHPFRGLPQTALSLMWYSQWHANRTISIIIASRKDWPVAHRMC